MTARRPYSIIKRPHGRGWRYFWWRVGFQRRELPHGLRARAVAIEQFNAEADALAARLAALPPERPGLALALEAGCAPRPDAPLIVSRVYAIRAGAGPIKFGYCESATAVASRLETLQVGNHETLALLIALAGRLEDERHLHAALATHRLRGEWFAPEPPVLAMVDNLRRIAAAEQSAPVQVDPQQREQPFTFDEMIDLL